MAWQVPMLAMLLEVEVRWILLTFMGVFLSSCAFVGYGGVGDAVYESANTPRYHHLYTPPRPRDSAPETLGDQLKRLAQNTDRTTEQIEREWGKPDKVVVTDEKRKALTYNRGLRWKGIVLVVGIPLPIPLVVPVGNKTITFNINNDKVENWSIRDDHYCASYAGFNLIPIDPEGKTLGLTAETSCEWHGDMSPYEGKMACTVPFYKRCYPSPL